MFLIFLPVSSALGLKVTSNFIYISRQNLHGISPFNNDLNAPKPSIAFDVVDFQKPGPVFAYLVDASSVVTRAHGSGGAGPEFGW